MAYSKDDIREIIKNAPRASCHSGFQLPFPPVDNPPDHYLQVQSYEEYAELADTFMQAVHRRDPVSKARLRTRVEHESQHGHAITKLGGIAVPTLVVYRPEGSILARQFPFDVKTLAKGLDPDSPEYIVSTAYPEELSVGDQAFLDRRGLSVTDVDALARNHGWHDLRPLSLQQGPQGPLHHN